MDPEPEDKEAFLKDFFGPGETAQGLAGSQSVAKEEPPPPPGVKVKDPRHLARPTAEVPDEDPQTLSSAVLGDPLGLSINKVNPEAMDKILGTYAQKNDVEILGDLGQGEYSKAYKVTSASAVGEGRKILSLALKVTLNKKEAETYEKVRQQREQLVSAGAPASILPNIYNVQVVATPLLMPSESGRTLELSEARDRRVAVHPEGKWPRRLKAYFILMELLEPLDKEIEIDVFGAQRHPGADPEGYEGWRGARRRFINNYLAAPNIYSALKQQLSPQNRWGRLRDVISSSPVQEALPDPAASRAKTAPHFEMRELGITDESDRVFVPIFQEIAKQLPPLRQKFEEGDPAEDRPNLDGTSGNLIKAYRDLERIIGEAFEKHVSNPQDLQAIDMALRMRAREGSFNLPVLMHQMNANVRLPQYDPEYIAGSGIEIRNPSEFKSPEAKKAFLRLKALEKASKGSIQYGDVHRNNMMQRPNGELVVADVGLFWLKDEDKGGGLRQHGALRESKRLQQLAGLILK